MPNDESAIVNKRVTPVASLSDYWNLMKPRVMSLSIFTGWVGLVLAPSSMNVVLAIVSILALAIGAGAAGAFNMWYDHDIDRLMSRTASRPTANDKIHKDEAMFLGFVMSVVAVTLMFLAANWLAAGLLAFTIWFYAYIYTQKLKRRTDQNIVIGGLAGALPPLIGWTAATGSIALEPIFLVGIIFMWTPAHFWALALYKSGDYKAASLPMLPLTRGPKVTRQWIFIYAVATALLGVMTPYWFDYSLFSVVIALALGVALVLFAWRLFRSQAGNVQSRRWSLYKASNQDASARDLFICSILYLFLIFLSFGVEGLILGS